MRREGELTELDIAKAIALDELSYAHKASGEILDCLELGDKLTAEELWNMLHNIGEQFELHGQSLMAMCQHVRRIAHESPFYTR